MKRTSLALIWLSVKILASVRVVLPVILTILIPFSCSDEGDPPPQLSSEAKILSFQFSSADNSGITQTVSGTIDESSKEISVVFPVGSIDSDLTNLVASFTLSEGATVKVSSVVQQSGTTATDFSVAVTYVVEAEDGTAVSYTVSVSVTLGSEAQITSFQFLMANNTGINQDVVGTIDESLKEISLIFPVGSIDSDLSVLIASFTLSEGAIVLVGENEQQSGTTANDFSDTVTYIVEAEDGTTVSYTVSVSVTLSSEAQLTSFQFLISLFLSANRSPQFLSVSSCLIQSTINSFN